MNGAASAAAIAQNESYSAHLSHLGETFEHLDAQAMHELTGSRHYMGGLYTPGTVMLQPAGYVRGFAAGLARHVQIFENSAATALTRVHADWKVETAHGTITAPRVILANNGHLESFGFEAGRLMHLFLYASMSPELDAAELARLGGASRWGITPSDPMGTTLRRIDTGQGGNRMVTRTCATLRSNMVSRGPDLVRATTVQRRKFDARFPQLAGLKPEFEWAGHLCLTRTGVSILRELEPGLFSACAQNGLGTARGTLTGMGAAELALGTKSAITDHYANAAPPPKLPPQPARDIAANAFLRWQEWRARSE